MSNNYANAKIMSVYDNAIHLFNQYHNSIEENSVAVPQNDENTFRYRPLVEKGCESILSAMEIEEEEKTVVLTQIRDGIDQMTKDNKMSAALNIVAGLVIPFLPKILEYFKKESDK